VDYKISGIPRVNPNTGQPALASTPVKNLRQLLEQIFTVHMLLLMATSTFGLGEDTRVLLDGATYIISAPFLHCS